MTSMTLIAILFSLGAASFAVVSYKAIVSASQRYQAHFKVSADINLSQMFLFIDAEKLLLLSISGALIAGLFVWIVTDLWIPAVIIIIACLLSPKFIYRHLQEKRKTQIVAHLPDTLLSVSRSMKAGASLNQAIDVAVDEESGPLAQELSLVLRELRIGIDFNLALRNLEKRVDSEDLSLVISGMMISRDIGGNLSDTLDRLADTLRRKIDMEGKINALTSQGRLQGVVMTLLPFLVGVALFQIEPEHMSRLFYDPLGWACIAIILTLEITGYFFIRRIVNIDV